MEVDVVLGSDRHPIERGRLVAPLAERCHDFFVDPMPDGLQDAGFDDVALRVDGYFDNDVALKISGEFGTRDWRVRIHDGISHVHFMSRNRSVNHGAKRRSRARIVLRSFCVRRSRLMVGGRFWCRRSRSRLGRRGFARQH